MDLQDLHTLLDYHYWARDRVLTAAGTLTPEQFTRDLGSSFRSVRDTLVHTYSAEWIWYQRWQGTSPAAHLPPDQFADVSALAAEWASHEARMREFLETLGEQAVGRVFHYTGMNGQPASSAYHEMLQHLVNHGSYHRGQVTTMLRQLGAAAPRSMDLIAYLRAHGAHS